MFLYLSNVSSHFFWKSFGRKKCVFPGIPEGKWKGKIIFPTRRERKNCKFLRSSENGKETEKCRRGVKIVSVFGRSFFEQSILKEPKTNFKNLRLRRHFFPHISQVTIKRRSAQYFIPDRQKHFASGDNLSEVGKCIKISDYAVGRKTENVGNFLVFESGRKTERKRKTENRLGTNH